MSTCTAGLVLLTVGMHPRPASGQIPFDTITVETSAVMRSLLLAHDTDGDLKITANDRTAARPASVAETFDLKGTDGRKVEIRGVYLLSNLLQELAIAKEEGRKWTTLQGARVFLPPVERISRTIRDRCWEGLTRSIDERGLAAMLADSKIAGDRHTLYVPSDDSLSLGYFRSAAIRRPEWGLAVHPLPPRRGSLESLPPDAPGHGLLSLALHRNDQGEMSGVPFVVPGGRFNELYGWDSYFIVLGLLQDNRVDLARSIVENLVYEINRYGGILNANRTYYLSRSQPPFLTSMAREVFERLPDGPSRIDWLRKVLQAAVREHRNVWCGEDHRTLTGLTRYMDSGHGIPPEVEPGHFDVVFRLAAAARRMDPAELERQYRAGKITDPALDLYFTHDRAMRESGHDTSYRLVGVCADLVTVDLNSLLFKYERDLAELIGRFFGGELTLLDGSITTAAEWSGRAARRQWLVNQYLWSTSDSMFVDLDFVRMQPRPYVAPTALYPLWAGLASEDQAGKIARTAIRQLEMPGGLTGSTEASRGPVNPDRPLRQWDYPFGWPPHQMLAWAGLRRYGYDQIAARLAYRWLFTVTVNAVNYNGTLTEKYDVVHRTHQVFAEYGNIGTAFAYITQEGFGWTNASYQVGLTYLDESQQKALDNLRLPEDVFP